MSAIHPYTIKPRPNKRQHAPTPLGQLLNRHNISLSRVSHWLVQRGVQFTSTASISRVVRGKATGEMQSMLNPLIADGLRQHLLEMDIPNSQIDAELQEVFTEGEYQPMAIKRVELTPDELSWFGLKKDPFAEFPTRRDEVFISPDLQRIIDRVIDAIKYPAFISVTGEIGSGKTVIRAMIEDYVEDQPNVHIIWPEFMFMQLISPTQIAQMILEYFEVQRIPRGAAALGKAVKKTLQQQFQAGNRVTIAFDECHRMSDASLSSLKNFYEMGSGGFQRWLTVMLFGQKVFDARLEDEKFREINERIIPNPMPDFKAYAADYMRFRLAKSGAAEDLFDSDAIAYIAENAKTPLQLGNLANKSLRLSKDEFRNKTVIGAAIKEKMFFETHSKSKGWVQR